MRAAQGLTLLAGAGVFLACADRTAPWSVGEGVVACVEADDCDDGLECNGQEVCESGRCVGGDAPDCDDEDACTLDGCTEGTGCIHVESSAAECTSGSLSDPDVSSPIVLPRDVAEPPQVACPTSAQSLTAQTQEELEFFRGIACIAGDVSIGGEVTNLSPLSNLARVDGSVSMSFPPDLELALPSLRRIGGELLVDNVSLSELEWIGGALEIRGGLSTSDSFPRLRFIGADFTVKTPEDFTPIEVPSALSQVEYVGGSVAINPRMTARLESLRTVGGALSIEQMSQEQLDSLPELQVVGKDLSIVGIDSRGSIQLPSLEHVGGKLKVFANPKLSDLAAPLLAFARTLEVRLNPELSACRVDTLVARVEHALEDAPQICCNSGCGRCESGACEEPGAVDAGQSSFLQGDFTVFPAMAASMGAVQTAESLRFFGWESLSPPSLPLQSVEFLQIKGSKWKTLPGFAELTSVGELAIVDNYYLESLSGLENLESVGSVLIRNNTSLESLAALDPQRDGRLKQSGDGSISSNYNLSQCEAELVVERLEALNGAAIVATSNQVCSGTCEGLLCSQDSL